MLNISGLSEGIVLDHIKAGKSLDIYYQLGLNKLDSQIAIIKNAHSKKMGRKDIIKIEGNVLDRIDLEVLGYIDHNITPPHLLSRRCRTGGISLPLLRRALLGPFPLKQKESRRFMRLLSFVYSKKDGR